MVKILIEDGQFDEATIRLVLDGEVSEFLIFKGEILKEHYLESVRMIIEEI